MRGDEGGGRWGSLDAEGGVDTLVIERLQKNQGQYVEDTREEHLHRELLVEGDDNSKAPGVLVAGKTPRWARGKRSDQLRGRFQTGGQTRRKPLSVAMSVGLNEQREKREKRREKRRWVR